MADAVDQGQRRDLLAGQRSNANRDAAWADFGLPFRPMPHELSFAEERTAALETEVSLEIWSQAGEDIGWFAGLTDW